MPNQGGTSAIREIFKDLGFRRNEIKTYLTALYVGDVTISDLARHIKLPRSSTQEAINHLRQKGLVECYLKGRRKFWIAKNPEVLLTQIRNQETAMRHALSRLRLPASKAHAKPSVRLITGLEEMASLSTDIIRTKQHIYGILDWDALVRMFGFELLQNARKKYQENYLKMHLLVPRSSQAAHLKETASSEFLKIKFLPTHFSFHNAYMVYGEKTIINLLNSPTPLAVCIEDRDLANFFHLIFDFFWNRPV